MEFPKVWPRMLGFLISCLISGRGIATKAHAFVAGQGEEL